MANRLEFVVTKDTSLPPLCVKCGSDKIVRLNQSVVWLNPLYYLTILLGGLPFLVVYLVFRKKVELSVPLCEHHRKLVHWMRICTVLILIGCPITALLLIEVAPDWAGLGILLILVMLIGAFITLRLQRPLTAVNIDDKRAVLKGACDAFLLRIESAAAQSLL